MSSARHFFSPPLAREILSLAICMIVARRDHREMIPDMIYARAYTRHVDNRAPFFFNSTAIMQSLLKTITIAWEGGRIPVARQINSRGARYHQDNQRGVRVRVCMCVCPRMYQTNYRLDRLKIETIIPCGHFNFQKGDSFV